tara:strand:+ start:21623 stop:23374 length:1752 start_codon:yes stop_codon:yes gene_type:complete
MTPTQYTRVKEVFSAAIKLPQRDRVAFAQQQCSETPEILTEVLSLLKHHFAGTVLESPPSRPPPDTIIAEPSSPIDPNLVLKDVWEDNRQILRRRLIAIASVMAVLIATSMVRLFTYHNAVWGYGGRIGTLAVTVGCASILVYKPRLTLLQIRGAEVMVMASVGLLAIVIVVRLMLESAARLDAVTLISVHNWNFFVWTLIILVYGVFMPNTWRRAATILVPGAIIPGLVTLLAIRLDSRVGMLLGQDEFGMPLPVTLIAAGVSIYAAHLIHGARLFAYTAQRLAQYKVKRFIGEGGMGQVFEAEHRMLKRPCAIKLIQPEYCADDQALQRFQCEVRATAKLTHPHTIEIYDYGQTKDGIFFFAMELLPGMNLRNLVDTTGTLPAPRAVHFLVQVCEALREAHSAGMIHRDVKPANIFASQRGGIDDFTKLLDFGVVRELSLNPQHSVESNMVAGTPGFMSPEQIASPCDVDARSDIYSVGAVAYFLLTGRPPFIGDSPLETMMAQVNQTPDLPSTYRDDIPRDLQSVIMRCLAKEVGKRIAGADCLLDELKRCKCADRWTQRDATTWWREQAIKANAQVPTL